MQKLSTRGTGASSHAKGESPKLSFWLSNNAMHLLVTPAISQTPRQKRRYLMYMPRHQSKCRASQSMNQLCLQPTSKTPSPTRKLLRILLSINQAARQSMRESLVIYGASSSTQACYFSSPCIDLTK